MKVVLNEDSIEMQNVSTNKSREWGIGDRD